MTGDERDRILGLLSGGPATVTRLAAGLGLPGGVVSYQLKLLEREGLVRVGATRTEHGVATPVYVSAAAAAPPPLQVPVPLPGLTFTGDSPYPIPVWTTPQQTGGRPPASAGYPTAQAAGGYAAAQAAGGYAAEDAPAGDPRSVGRPDDGGPPPAPPETPAATAGSAAGPERAAATSTPVPAELRPPAARRAPGRPAPTATRRPAQLPPAAARPPQPWPPQPWPPQPWPPQPWPPQPRPPAGEPGHQPRMLDVRRVPIDDATFYEFARRLDALAREFAARATPGAPATELTIALTRPNTEGAGS